MVNTVSLCYTVPKWKTEDLVRAYRLGCERHGTKPLNKVIQQLSVSTCFQSLR